MRLFHNAQQLGQLLVIDFTVMFNGVVGAMRVTFGTGILHGSRSVNTV